MFARLKERAAALKREAFALSIAVRDRRVPWYARAVMILVLAYAFSPIDLIPDFIPVLGYLDDLVLIPLGVALAMKMVPAQVMREARQQALELEQRGKPFSWLGAVIIIALWLIAAGLVIWWIVRAANLRPQQRLPLETMRGLDQVFHPGD